ncbi:TPA: hypothetical protein NJ384_004489 [Vibrio parahaemolyticus]|nr:hypothetical protein [Vibrio parahaemolyticus]
MKKFYHIDRSHTLTTGMTIELSSSKASQFGSVYLRHFKQNNVSPTADLSNVSPLVNTFDYPFYREFYLEVFRLGHPELTKLERFSRLNSLYAAETLDDVKQMVERLQIKPGYKVFEVFTSGPYVSLDMTWLDQKFPKDIREVGYYYLHYWLGNKIENDQYLKGHESRGSLMEVLICSDVIVGEEIAIHCT